jgi:vancomycin permeability regulator SanA
MAESRAENLPGQKKLLRTWLLLMGLTVVSMVAARLDSADNWQTLPLWGVALVLFTTGFKVQQVLMVYLNLRVSSAAWRYGFIGLLVATLVLVFSGYLAAHYTAG